ncbi:hypothetical protein F0919_00920 [Taibaiella lutea]|uniref:Uncharacterized protein n=1 Tax=Taibaiella lutea TaxID=2608001 RepID=A0A5M6CPD0_9BACT|nr:polysaccharide biosynthesis/export family protein [Taibaiella lutea]KAA5536260.1 hypothetical protein F0919_00920 [Taibaiella lutea]
MNYFTESRIIKNFYLVSLLFVILFSISSCVSNKRISYFQDISSDSSNIVYKNGIQIPVTKIEDITIQNGDILNVTIQTIDPDLNASLRNNYNTTPQQGASASVAPNGNTNAVFGYLVDDDGIIELPIAGKIKVGGLTTAEAKEAIREKAKSYYKDPIVNVQIANFKITVIGEVGRPGSYLINGERVSILDAIGQAGDLTIFGLRDNVLLSRKENGKQTIVRFDLTSSNIYQSPYFYLKQGDVIYVQPSKGKASANDTAMLRYYALFTSTLSLIVVLIARL